jgi:hypothetical protein
MGLSIVMSRSGLGIKTGRGGWLFRSWILIISIWQNVNQHIIVSRLKTQAFSISYGMYGIVTSISCLYAQIHYL